MKEMEQETNVQTQEEEQKDDKREEQDSASNLPKTQEELDALIEGRIKREHRKWNKQVQQPQDAPVQPTAPQEAPANDAYQKELMEAKAQIEAFKSGVRTDAVEDAVYLAVREVEKSGDEVDEDTIREALKAVLKRHPSWKNTEKQKTAIKVGADAEGSEGNPKKNPAISGKVIF
jgi:hypothetical protein